MRCLKGVNHAAISVGATAYIRQLTYPGPSVEFSAKITEGEPEVALSLA
jgi:hypothetical protein